MKKRSRFTSSSEPVREAGKGNWFVLLSGLLVAILIIFLSSCQTTSSLEEIKEERGVMSKFRGIDPAVSLFSLPTSVSLDKVELYLQTGSGATGDITVEIQDAAGLAVSGSTTVPVSDLAVGAAWHAFVFPVAPVLERDSSYRVTVIRSDPHDYGANNYIFWKCSPASVPNPYPDGHTDVYPAWNIDYAFRTFTEGGVDQEQVINTYGFAVYNTSPHWQEFKADYPKVTLAYVDLNLTVGGGATGSVIVQVRDQDGSTILSETSILASAMTTGTAWRKFKLGTSLYRDQTYRIYMRRTSPHSYPAGDYVFWRCSPYGAPNPYPDGVTDLYPSWNIDFAFRTYNPVTVDQEQLLNSYSFFTHTSFRWQEFVPRIQ